MAQIYSAVVCPFRQNVLNILYLVLPLTVSADSQSPPRKYCIVGILFLFIFLSCSFFFVHSSYCNISLLLYVFTFGTHLFFMVIQTICELSFPYIRGFTCNSLSVTCLKLCKIILQDSLYKLLCTFKNKSTSTKLHTSSASSIPN